MRLLIPALLIASLAASAVASGEELVEAAAANKSKRKKSTSRVITNEDVRKSKGTLVETRGGTPQEPLPAPESLVEKHEAARAERTAYELRLRLAESVVADLEQQLARLEQSYFEENDLTRRDQVIAKRFDEIREKLDAAAAELAAAKRPE